MAAVMDTKYKRRFLVGIACFTVLLNQVWISAIKSPGRIERAGDSCDPVVNAGKEVPQKRKYHVDDKRSFGKPGNKSQRYVQRKSCEIDTTLELPEQPHDCADIKASGMNVSGVYGIYPNGGNGLPFNVYCDMETDGGGWTIFQRRMDGSVDFSRNWLDYKYGFGSVSSEHWLGNERIHRLSIQKSYKLRVDLENFQGQTSYASYSRFILENETSNYALSLGIYSGKAGDSLSHSSQSSFSTPDRDNDAYEFINCAKGFASGWWFKNYYCFDCNLNGIYQHNSTRLYVGVSWLNWFGKHSLKATEMKIRPVV